MVLKPPDQIKPPIESLEKEPVAGTGKDKNVRLRKKNKPGVIEPPNPLLSASAEPVRETVPPATPETISPSEAAAAALQQPHKFFSGVVTEKKAPYSFERANEPADPKTSPANPAGESAVPPAPESETERKNREEFERIKKEFDENENKIAEARHKSKGRLRIIYEALGIRKRSVEDEEIKTFLEKRKKLHPELMAAGRQILSGKEEDWKEFETKYHETAIAIRSRLEEDGLRAKEAGFGNAFVGLANVSKNYRDFISKQFLKDGKLTVKGFAKGMATAAAIGFAATSLIAASLPALGVVAVGSAGASAAAVWRGFSSVGAGYSLKKRMEKGFVEKKEKEIQEDVLKIIEAKKQKTDEEWKVFLAEREGGKSITGEEQGFADADAKHKRLALGLAGGTFIAGAIVSHYAVGIRSLFGQAWEKVTQSFGGTKAGFYEPAHSPIPDAEVQPKAGGAIDPEKEGKPFLGDSHKIKTGENVWKVTRDMYIENAKEYNLKPDDPKIKNLFHSLKKQGFLNRMGIDAENFNDLSDADKIKILAENKTANAMEWYKNHHGGKLPSVVQEGNVVTLDDKGRLFVEDTSQIKAGAVHQEPTRGVGRAAAENYGRGGSGKGGGAIDTSQYDQQIENARARGAAADAWGKSEVARLGAEAQVLNEQAVAGLTSANARLWNSWLENLGGFKLNTPASQIQEAIGRLSPGITSDQPLPPTADEMVQRGNTISFTQETFQRFPPLNGRETMQQYLERMSRTNFNLFKALSIKNRL